MTIEERLQKLEQELGLTQCRHRRVLIAFCISIMLTLILAAAVYIKIHAKDKEYGDFRKVQAVVFDLVDERGQTQALLSALKGGPSLSMLDSNGCPRIILSV